jgi:hypothetical protein
VKAALQVARICFGLVPLQRWVNGFGVVLIALSVGAALMGPGREFSVLLPSGVLGMMLIAMAPGFCGGAMLRHGLSRRALHLWPHGRARMLLGATLAITLLAAVAALPVTIVEPRFRRSIAAAGLTLDGNLALAVLRSFVVAWNVAAIFWVATFVVTASRLATTVAWLTMMGLPALGKLLDDIMPGVVLPRGATGLLLATGPIAWILLVLWCLKAHAIRPLPRPWQRKPRADGPTNRQVRQKPPTRLFATVWYLNGSGSIAGTAAVGAAVALFGVLMFGVFIPFVASVNTSLPPPSWLKVPALYLPAYAVVAVLVSRLLALRARFLWLRAGMDRTRLFHLTERYSLLLTALTLGGGAAVLLPLTLVQQPEIAASVFTYGATTCVVVWCMIYIGLSEQGFAAIVPWLGVVALFLYRLPFIRPQPDASLAAALGTMTMFAVVALLLRWHARRRWLLLDWHAKRIPVVPRRAG